jgi:Holliday junction resolvase RusA-like endonuclease
MKITLHGRPMTKKNSQQIARSGSRPFILQSKQYQQYEVDCLRQITGDKKRNLAGAIILRCLYYMPDRRSRPDLVGLLQATSDILEKAGVYVDDKQIISYDGSRIVGVDKDSPRAEIEVEEVKA